VLDHDKEWIEAEVVCRSDPKDGARLHLQATSEIKNGASGGPVINDEGHLVGLVSFVDDRASKGTYYGMTPRPHLALPVWVWQRIAAVPNPG
jgi:hypothetical protein